MYEFVEIHNTATKKSGRVLRFPVPKAPTDTRPGVVYLEIEPGAKQIVPFAVACSAFGHPGERDDSKHRNRTDLYRQLRLYWGFHEGFDTETEDQRGDRSDISSWEAKAPPFKVSTMDGDRIPMILDDPAGVDTLPESVVELDPQAALREGSADVLRSLIEQQAHQIAELRELLVAQTSGRPVDTDDAALPQPPVDEDAPAEDAPKAPSVSKR